MENGSKNNEDFCKINQKRFSESGDMFCDKFKEIFEEFIQSNIGSIDSPLGEGEIQAFREQMGKLEDWVTHVLLNEPISLIYRIFDRKADLAKSPGIRIGKENPKPVSYDKKRIQLDANLCDFFGSTIRISIDREKQPDEVISLYREVEGILDAGYGSFKDPEMRGTDDTFY